MSFYHRLSYELPADEGELFSIELWARGALGIESRGEGSRIQLLAYASDPLPPQLATTGGSWERRGVVLLGRERCAVRDWLAEHRRRARPLAVGRRFLLDPREPRPGVATQGRILLRVPARRAFGTGSHESTRLVLEWLEDLEVEGRAVLDLGAGTAVLSLAAERLGAALAVAIDVDPVAVFVASEIVRLNGGRVRLAAGGLSALAGAAFDIALVNVLPAEWLDEAHRLAPLVARRGCAVVSGVPREEGDGVAARLGSLGWIEVERRAAGDWLALRLERGAGA